MICGLNGFSFVSADIYKEQADCMLSYRQLSHVFISLCHEHRVLSGAFFSALKCEEGWLFFISSPS